MSRLRRWLRGFYLACVWTLAVLAVAWLGARLWALHVVRTAVPDFEAKYGSLDRKQWDREMPPPSENGGTYLQAAMILTDRTGPKFGRGREGGSQTTKGQVADPAPADLKVIVERNRLALELFQDAADLPRCVVVGTLPRPDQLLPRWDALLYLVRIERGLARQEITAGDDAAAAHRLQRILRVSACLSAEPTLIAPLVGQALERATMRLLHDELAEGRFDDSLELLSTSLDRANPVPTENIVRQEAATYQPGAWHGSHDGSRVGSSILDPFAVDGFNAAMSVRALGATLEHLSRPQPPPRWNPAWFFPWQLDRYMESIDLNFWFYDRYEKIQAAERALARAALAVRAGGLASGSYPDSLEGLDPKLLLPTSLVAERIRYSPQVDGSVSLSLAETERESKRIAVLSEHPRHFDFVWTLPPLAEPHGKAAPVE